MSDVLLEWMSFRSEGRADALPAQYMPGPPRRVLGDLAALAHIETPAAASWRIVPPVLACLPLSNDNEPTAVLCGARTPGLMRQLEEASQAAGGQITRTPVMHRPSIIRVSAPSYGALADCAARTGVNLQIDAGYTLLACVPQVESWPREACQMVGGRVGEVRRFSGKKAQWVETSLEHATDAPKGLFRIQRDWDWVTIFKSSRTDCAYIDDRAGRLQAAAKRRHLSWNPHSLALSLPISLFPPTLIARSLVLCTGSLPEFDRASRRISFRGVNAAMLRLVLAITGLRLT